MPSAAPARPVRARILEAATEITVESGWGAVTMAKLAERAGVSRQTVYNEVGGKPRLAETMVMTELARFLEVVDAELRTGDDAVDAIRRAAFGVLLMADRNPLLRAVVSASQGAGEDLLPLLTTHSEPLMAAAHDVIRARLGRFELGLDEHQTAVVIDMVVRVVLSHVMQPIKSADSTAEDIAWISARVLRLGE